MRFKHACLFLGMALVVGPRAFSAPIYSDDFDSGASGANWTTNASTGDNVADFAFDYSTVGIPSAPHSTGGTTIGLKMQSNRNAHTAGYTGVSVSPTGLGLSGDYELHADVWLNYQTPNGSGSGTTQYAGMGILTNGTTPQWAGTSAGFPAVSSAFAQVTVDGGNSSTSNSDYRVIAPTAPAVTSPPYTASGTAIRDNSNAYYQTNFPAITLPASLTHGTDFPGQTGMNVGGTTAFAWHDWSVTKAGNMVTWAIDGKSIATFDATTIGATSGTDFLLNYNDSNAGQSGDALSQQLLFGLFDNVRVVPEPTSCVLSLAALFGLVGVRARRNA